MKAKIAHRNIDKMNPEFKLEEFRKLKTKAEKRVYLQKNPRVIKHKYGDIVDHPDAFLLVLHGLATPEDDECKEVCNLTDEDIQVKLHAYDRLSKGMGTGMAEYDVAEETTSAEDEFNELFKEDDNGATD
jgi:hypothetical protein